MIHFLRIGILGLAASMISLTGNVRADIVVSSTGGTEQDTRGRHTTNNAGPGGNSLAKPTAQINAASVTLPSILPYPVPIGPWANVSAPATLSGIVYTSTATASLTGGAGFWNDSASTATITKAASALGQETARAVAVGNDPAAYSVTFDSAFTPEVVFTIKFFAGASLRSLTSGTGEYTSARYSGYSESSLVAGHLVDFDWFADSNNLSGSTFSFHSNPVLGLNDAAIQSLFLSNVSNTGGVNTLTSTISIEYSVFPTLAPGILDLNYTFGGETVHEVTAAVPEPGSMILAGSMASLFAIRRWRGQRNEIAG
ncbi:MAG: hypothetical protein K1X57_00760 [Gemmataceae bacterium]|nr:hypothetical protein [Gemmataceae bacterium]